MDTWYEDDRVLDQHLLSLSMLTADLPVLPEYEEISLVSSGGQATVYSAIRRSDGERVALKMFDQKSRWWGQAALRLRSEAEDLALLDDPRIVRFLDLVEDRLQRPVLVMEWVGGGTLSEYLPFGPRSEKFTTLDSWVHFVAELAEAVHAAHACGVFHRDLKPSNVMLDDHGRPRLVDFGLGQGPAARARALTKTGSVLGTLAYLAPEQLSTQSETDLARVDVYGLGGILYRGLCGEPPHPLRGTGRAGVAPPPSTVRAPTWDARLEGVVMHALHPRPTERYASAQALAEDLRAWTLGTAMHARAFGRAQRFAWHVRHGLRKPALRQG